MRTTVKPPTAVLLLSEKSSGSTILQYEMFKHLGIKHISYTPHNDFETLYWVKAACILKMPAVDFWEGKRFYKYALAKKSLIDTLKGNIPGFKIPADDEQLVFGGWEALYEQFGPIFFEKSPHHLENWPALALILRHIENTQHDVRVIGLVRNPMSVVYSTWTRWLSPPEERQFMWARSYRNLIVLTTLLPQDKFLLIRYEDMVTKKEETFRSVCDFLELDYRDNIGGDIQTYALNKWRSDEQFTLQLDPSVMAIAKYFGYTDEEMFNPPNKPGLSDGQRRLRALKRRYENLKSRLLNRWIRPSLPRSVRYSRGKRR